MLQPSGEIKSAYSLGSLITNQGYGSGLESKFLHKLSSKQVNGYKQTVAKSNHVIVITSEWAVHGWIFWFILSKKWLESNV